ncbi:MAG: DUF2628 domain-containing protein [Oscillospiraceae bacterium]|jgi:hypothetical protein|nr:DUF2628 domain-containing protein [Oscillospiraceae bacterium]
MEQNTNDEKKFNFCPKCGRAVSGGAEARFCVNCGYAFEEAAGEGAAQPVSQASAGGGQQASQGIDYDLYIQNNAVYYAEKFRCIRQTEKDRSWNWAAFLFAPFWMIYRKLYTYGFGLLAICLLLSFVWSFWASLLLLGLYILTGLYGNTLYLQQIEKLIQEKPAAMKYMNEPMFFQKKGGVDAKAAGFAAGGCFLLSLVISFVPFLFAGSTSTCAALTCNEELSSYNKIYCYDHACDEYGCDNKTAVFSDYCFVHQILMPFRPYCKEENCGRKATADGEYCWIHD